MWNSDQELLARGYAALVAAVGPQKAEAFQVAMASPLTRDELVRVRQHLVDHLGVEGAGRFLALVRDGTLILPSMVAASMREARAAEHPMVLDESWLAAKRLEALEEAMQRAQVAAGRRAAFQRIGSSVGRVVVSRTMQFATAPLAALAAFLERCAEEPSLRQVWRR